MKVIDISDWNENIDWSAILDEGVEGVIVKISEGRALTELYENHIAACAVYNLKWGVYCYTHALTTERAEEEAEVVCNAIEEMGYGAPPLKIWFDVEDNEVLDRSNEEVTAICSSFISTCNSYGFSAGIYANYYTLRDQINCYDLAEYVPYWVADYSSTPYDFKNENPNLRVVGVQYTQEYKIRNNFYDMSKWEE